MSPIRTSERQRTDNRSKRIASNTMLLFARMFVLTILNLYAVRLVLQGLGEEDYGLFNTMAGVVLTGSFISSVLSLSIQRFYSVAIGEKNDNQLRDIFSASINIITGLSLLTIIVFETIGLWFVETKLIIPETRMEATMLIYQFALASFIFSLIQIPFMAAVFAHEDMGIYALVSTIECVLRLLVAYFIGKNGFDNLVFYSGGLLLVSILSFACYAVTGFRKYAECHYRKINASGLYRKMLSFSGWTLFGSIAAMAIIQGNTILTNIFFGPVITAAFAISIQIYNAFNTLCGSMVLAFRPAMIKSYAEKNIDYLNRLFSVSNKFILYILAAIAIPLIFEMQWVLELWLGNVSKEMVLFARLIIVYVCFLAMSSPITIIMQASGHIKEYHLPVESATLLCLPLTWLLFKLDFPSYSILLSMIGVTVVAHLVRIVCLKRYYPSFSPMLYVRSLIIPAIFIITAASAPAWFIQDSIHNRFIEFASITTVSSSIVIVTAFFWGLSDNERDVMQRMLANIRKKLPST